MFAAAMCECSANSARCDALAVRADKYAELADAGRGAAMAVQVQACAGAQTA